ncbi:helix-turn-helix domain-containing protein [Pseudomonas plecoglossicida]|uniref:helix-turn-helix domain-containing protein n=1 Tax=Pseudomonas plecoglossicida TaxID=70775 RepID=UPI003D1F3380
MSSKLFPAVLARLKQLTGANSDVQLARSLNISPQTLSSWKIRQSIPYSLCIDLADIHGCSLDWLLLGNQSPDKSDDGWENDMIERLRSLSSADRHATLLYIQDKQRIQELEQRLDQFSSALPVKLPG